MATVYTTAASAATPTIPVKPVDAKGRPLSPAAYAIVCAYVTATYDARVQAAEAIELTLGPGEIDSVLWWATA